LLCRIVCGIDHTSGGDRAAATAAQLARDLRCDVSLVHVLRGARLGESGDSIAIGVAEEHRWLQELSSEYGLAPTTRVAVFGGDPAEALIDAAQAEDAALIVVGSRGLHEFGDAVLGSVSCALMRDAPCPVVVAPPALPVPLTPLSLRPVVCGVEGTDRDQPTLRLAADLALRLGAALHAVHTFDPRPLATGPGAVMPPVLPVLSEAAEATLEHAVSEAGVEAKRRGVSSPPAEGLRRVAGEIGAGVLVVGSRGRGKLGSAILGSVAIKLAAEARLPVVVLPHGALLEGGSGHYEVADIVA
jgi:nucleotide-binding universal stress UspA family protein